jgi:hypothetical protein
MTSVPLPVRTAVSASGSSRAAPVSMKIIFIPVFNALEPRRKHRFTYLLTPWNRVLPEKLKRPELLKKFPAFYGTRRFMAVFITAHHQSLS